MANEIQVALNALTLLAVILIGVGRWLGEAKNTDYHIKTLTNNFDELNRVLTELRIEVAALRSEMHTRRDEAYDAYPR